MVDQDEPILGEGRRSPSSIEDRPVRERIRGLLEGEPYGVLCTQGDDQPYGSVVAIASSHDLRTLLFATARETRKFRLITTCDRVALVVDSRGRHPGELMTVEAVTATGRARVTEDESHVARLLAKHPAMRSFVEAPTTEVLRVDVMRYLHVHRFQEVCQWIPTDPA